MICPACKTSLYAKGTPQGVLWKCEKCSGTAANLAVLRKYLNSDIVREFWLRTISESTPSDRKCPSCAQALRAFTTCRDNRRLSLDLCQHCQLIWFDRSELEAFPQAESVPPSEIDQNLAIAKVQFEAELENREQSLESISARGFEILPMIIQLLLSL